MTTNQILFHRLDSNGQVPKCHHPGDAGWDLFTSVDTIIPPQQFVDVPTSICLGLPEHLYVEIHGRSSTLRKWGCLVIPGIIDSGYRGEMFVAVYNLSNDKSITIPKSTRLAQLIFREQIKNIQWLPCSDLPRSDRDTAGFGSTGV